MKKYRESLAVHKGPKFAKGKHRSKTLKIYFFLKRQPFIPSHPTPDR
jgi:hypothetical protein